VLIVALILTMPYFFISSRASWRTSKRLSGGVESIPRDICTNACHPGIKLTLTGPCLQSDGGIPPAPYTSLQGAHTRTGAEQRETAGFHLCGTHDSGTPAEVFQTFNDLVERKRRASDGGAGFLTRACNAASAAAESIDCPLILQLSTGGNLSL